MSRVLLTSWQRTAIENHCRLACEVLNPRLYCRWGLDNCGDAEAGEWAEHHDRYFHLRRRLSPAEQELVGPVVDVRGTPEAERRTKPYLHLLPEGWTE